MEDPKVTDPDVLKDKAQLIYTCCDAEKSNSVPVGVLINYVRRFMQDYTSELLDLQAALDPNNTNPCITSEVFYKGMSEWAVKFYKDADCFVNENSLHEPHPSDSYLLNERDFPFMQSTPQIKLGQQLLQKCEGGINLNLSNVSGYSLTECSIPIMDAGLLEEKIKELEYQLCKINSENDLLKQQLASTEEQNENLQSELSDVKKRFSCAQQMMESLKKNKKEADDLKEELLEAKKQIEHMRNNYSASEKKVQNLTSWIKQLEEEKSIFSKKTEKNLETTQNLNREMCDLQDELMSKCMEIHDLESQIVGLKEQLNEKGEGYEHLSKTNDATKGIAMDELMEKVQEHEKCVNIIQSYEEDIAKLKALLNEFENNSNQATHLQQISDNEKQLHLLQQDLTHKDQMISNLQDTIVYQEKDINHLRSEIRNECEIKNTLWQNIQDLKAESSKKDVIILKCNELEKKLEVYEKNYSILKEKCSGFEEANGKLRTANIELENTHKDQKEQLNKLSQEITVYKQDIKKYKDDENQQTKMIEYVNNALTKAQEENRKLNSKVAILQSEVKHWKEKVVELTHENKSYKTLLQEQEKQIIQYKKDLASVKLSLKEKHIDLAKIETEYDALLDNLSTLKISYKEKEIEHLNVKQENDALRSEITMKEEKCEEYINELEEFENFIKRVISGKYIFNQNLDQDLCYNKNSGITNRVSQIEQIINNLICENDAYKIAVEHLESETKLMQSAAKTVDETMNEKLLQLSSDKCKTENDYKGLLVKYENKNKKLTANNSKLRLFKKKSGLLQQKCKKITEENVVLKKDNTTLNENVIDLNNSIDELTTKCQAFEEAYDKLLSEFKTVDDQLQKQRNLHLVTEASLKRLIEDEKTKNIQWRKRLIKTDDDNAKLGKHCDNLKKQHELKQNELATIKNAFMKIKNSVMASRQNLIGSTDLVITKFKHVLYGQQGDMLNTMSDFAETEYNISTGSVQIETLVDEEIEKLNNQIYNTSKLLEYLASMYSKSTQDVEVQTEITENMSSVYMNTQQKPLNKFTLHQAKHVTSCPASPDSPSVMEQFKEFPNGTQNIVDEWQGILLDLESMENSEGEILTDSKFQQAFPNQPDTFLESMELHEDSPRKTLSKGEMEEKFTALVLTWTLDRNSVKERYQSQQELYQKYHQRIVQQLTQIIAVLMQHECFAASGTAAPVAQQLELVREFIDKGFTAAEQCGILRYEIRHTKYWNLVVNYVASLKQEIDATQILSLSTTESLPKTCNDNVNGDTPTKTGELRRRKPQSQKQLQVTTNSENFTCFKEDSVLPSVLFCDSWKSVLFIVMFFSFVMLGFMMYVQWQCSRSAIKKPVCPLDYLSKLLIKRVHIGIPPM